MSSAQKIHREICSLLLASLESLQQAHQQFLDLLHPHPAGTGSNPVERLKAKIQVTDCNKRLQHLSDMVKVSLKLIYRDSLDSAVFWSPANRTIGKTALIEH